MSSKTYPGIWSSELLGKISQIITGKTPSTKEPKYFGGDIPFIKPGDLDSGGYVTNTADTLTDEGLRQVPNLPANAVLVTCIGNLGKVGITACPSSSNQQINSVIVDKNINYKYLYYYITSMKWWLDQEASATTVAIINKSKFSNLPVVLPPLAEQKKIATKLDELLAQGDTIKTRLDAIPTILKRFRQSILAAAVSGKLTEEWRGSKAITFHQSPVTIGSETDEAPEGWAWRDLIDIAVLESGHTPRKTVPEYWDDGDVFWICLQDIRKAHGTVIENTKNKPTKLGIENSSARLLPTGTVCFSRDISVGYTTIMGKEMSTTQHFANWICGEELNNKYLMYSLMSAKDHLINSGQGTTVKTIYMPALKQFKLLTPSMEEQLEIVNQVEQLFSFANQIEKQVNSAQTRISNLTQSILAKAFRGELTADWREQNPDLVTGENSAEALLEKIRTERESLQPAKKIKRKMTA